MKGHSVGFIFIVSVEIGIEAGPGPGTNFECP